MLKRMAKSMHRNSLNEINMTYVGIVWYSIFWFQFWTVRSSNPEVFFGKSVLKICSKFTGVHPCRSAILIKLKSNFIEIALRHGYSPVNLLHIFRTTFSKNTSEWLLLNCDSASLSLSDWSFSPQTFWAKEERLSVPWKTVFFLFLSSIMFYQYR